MSPKELSFANLVKDLAVNDLAWLADDLMHDLPHTRYVIIFTARSGSSWLTNVLSATRQLGQPEEYLNPNFIRKVASAVNSTVPEEFLAGLQRRRQTPNGVFGLEAREIDIELFGADCFFQIFNGSTIFFNLWRRNMVAQAISLFRAAETQQYHVKHGEKAVSPPTYDTKSISKWMLHLALQENANVEMLVKRQRPFINLCYEDIVTDPQHVQHLFARRLGIDLLHGISAPPAESALTKIGDDWNGDTEKRFRTEAATLISKIEANRKIKFHTIGRSNGELIRPWQATPPHLRLVKSA